MQRWSGLVDALLSRCVVEPRFVARRPVERATRLSAMLRALPELTETAYFAAPPPLEPRSLTEGRYRGQPTKRLEWDMPVIAAAAGLGVGLRTMGARATLFTGVTAHGSARRPLWILIHGWLGGAIARDRREWPFDAILARYDLVHVVLPGHGSRRVAAKGHLPGFPTRNPLANVLGLALATAELRQLIGWLRSVGYARIGIAGTSIGANVAALFASVTADAERLLLDRPLVRMSEPLRRVAARNGDEYQSLLATLETLYAPVNPLLRALTLPSERVDILLGRHDGIVGVAAGQALAAHWGLLPLWFPGGHVLPIGRRNMLLPLLERL